MLKSKKQKNINLHSDRLYVTSTACTINSLTTCFIINGYIESKRDVNFLLIEFIFFLKILSFMMVDVRVFM